MDLTTTPAPVDPTRIDADDLIGLRALAERARPLPVRRARAPLVGAHRSRLRGRGMDYRESRHYEPGDDIRTMDWRITARAGRAHVKVFDEERERPVVLLVDLGPSMFFASRGVFKSVQAARLAALIGWAAIARGDRIGALVFGAGGVPGLAAGVGRRQPGNQPVSLPASQSGDESGDGQPEPKHQELSPTAGRRGQMRLIRALVAAGDPTLVPPAARDSAGPSSPAPLTAALLRLRRVARPGSLVLLLSDFYERDAALAGQLTRLSRHNEIIALQLVDPLELAPPTPARYPISDGRARAMLDTGDRHQRERYAAHFAAHHAAVRALTADQGIPLVPCATDADPLDCLRRAFAARGAPVSGAGAGVMPPASVLVV